MRIILVATLMLLPIVSAMPARDMTDTDAFLSRSWMGLYVFDLRTGEEIVSRQADRLFTPASVTKALTSAAVLSLVDSNTTFTTPVLLRGSILNDTLLSGDIEIVCSGDPTIGSRHFSRTALPDSIASRLKQMGVRQVSGSIKTVISGFVEEPVSDGWLTADLLYPYGTRHYGINYADNVMELSLPSERTTPKTPELRIEKSEGKRFGILAERRNHGAIRVTGRPGKRGYTDRIANPNPESALRQATVDALKKAGIMVDGSALSQDNQGVDTLFVHTSPRYVDILRSLMVRSDNLFAEAMLRTLAPGDSRDAALLEERMFWEDNDLVHSNIVMEDGSGLSRHNRISPRFLASVLAYMAGSSTSESYLRLFPRVGKEGTVRRLLKDTALEGKIALKSGSMRDVMAYAGYKFDDDGRPTHVIVFIANDFPGSRDKVRGQFLDFLLSIFETPTADQ